MRTDLVKGMKLIRYGISAKINLAAFVIIVLTGFAVETASVVLDPRCVGIGVILIAAACGFPAQLILSVDMSTMAQASPLKKKLQTAIPSAFIGMYALAALTLIVLERLIAVALGGDIRLLNHVFPVGILSAGLMIYYAFVYKFFVPSIVLLYVLIFVPVLRSEDLKTEFLWLSEKSMAVKNPLLAVLAAYAVVLAAAVLHYRISCALYKREFSKRAFGACIKR